MQLLDLKTGIDFGARGNLKEFDPAGFSPQPDNVSTWSAASTAELTFRLPPMRHDLRFTIEVFPFLGNGALTRQDCFIFLNGLFVQFHSVRTPVELVFTAARDLFSPRANRLSFALPHATSPKELNLGEDLRLLGLAFVKLAAVDPAAVAAVPEAPDTPPLRSPSISPMLGEAQPIPPERQGPPSRSPAATPERQEPPSRSPAAAPERQGLPTRPPAAAAERQGPRPPRTTPS